ncbi:MAG: 16S rRNA (cytosine(1402)-N(4))-methyltransferase [Spirochaetes bacterium]|nr:MAG: 16S rRNA (cytosine(1402)-N(4))-methyltransferase [Spirochaetota bacterium]
MNTIVHIPVMLKEIIAYLKPDSEFSLMVDGTIGEGGHAEAFLKLYPELFLIGIDRDSEILEKARERLKPYSNRVEFINANFAEFFENIYSDKKPDIILLDLGLSMYHFQRSGRGFTFLNDEPLDMRLAANSGLTASYIVNNYTKKDLADLLFKYGEERFARRIADKIVYRRNEEEIRTAIELADIVRSAVPPEYRRRRIHPATKTFQALRIAVNDELENLASGLRSASKIINRGGRIGVISFHSLEDRIVKHFFKDTVKGSSESTEMPNSESRGVFEIITKKPLKPDGDEIRQNPASRSALFRVLRRIK